MIRQGKPFSPRQGKPVETVKLLRNLKNNKDLITSPRVKAASLLSHRKKISGKKLDEHAKDQSHVPLVAQSVETKPSIKEEDEYTLTHTV